MPHSCVYSRRGVDTATENRTPTEYRRSVAQVPNNQSFLFNGFLDVVQVLQDVLLDHAFKEVHGQRHESGNDALGFGFVAFGQRGDAVGFGKAFGGEEDEAAIFGSGLIEVVLSGIGDPFVNSGGFAEEHAGLAPLEADEAVGWLFEDLDLLDAGDELGGVFDIGDGCPDGCFGGGDGDLGLDEHEVSLGVRLR